MLNISVSLTQPGPDNKTIYRQTSKLVESLDKPSLEKILSTLSVDGWTVSSWSVTEPLAYDLGFAAAKDANNVDSNPFNVNYWKHEEWWKGWEAYRESN